MKKKITTFLTFKDQAEEAVKLYTSIFKNSRILSASR
jgi:predicted 3-demethylubiquinone-9 3-methyltransferase (glyoxalase superfamily)